MRILRTAILAVAGGLLVAFAVNMLTPYPFKTLGGPIVAVTQQGSIDYWTGEITPMILILGDARPGVSRPSSRYPMTTGDVGSSLFPWPSRPAAS